MTRQTVALRPRPTRGAASTHSASGNCHNGAFAAYQVLVRAGDYDALVGRSLKRLLRAAAADQSLDFEIGALRIALARLLRDEPDVNRLSIGVARLARVAFQADALRSRPSDSNGITAILERTLAELDAEALLANEDPRPLAPMRPPQADS